MARLIRIAVNLLLIVSVTMQSTMLCALKMGCASACASQFTCLECGCCKVEKPVDRCGCCGGHAEASSDGDGAKGTLSCCAESSSDSSAVDSACHCWRAPEIPYAPVPLSHANENCEPLALSFALTELVKPKDQSVIVSANTNAPLSAWLHFSQIQLCVWRL